MQEYSIALRDAFTKGLRHDHRVGFNLNSVVDLFNMKPSEAGLQPVTTVTPKYMKMGSWPFPQLLRGKSQTLLATDKRIFQVLHDHNDELYRRGVYRLDSPIEPYEVKVGGAWHFIDLHENWILLNGRSTIFRLDTFGSGRAVGQDRVTVKTGCEFKGRVYLAGFEEGNFWSGDWDAFWIQAAEHVMPESNVREALAKKANFVWWSSIGGGDLMMLFDKRFMNSEAVFESLQRNEMGFMPLPFSGAVHCVKPIGEGVAVYGENGVAFLYPAGTTVGLRHISRIGCAQRGSVSGSSESHIWIDPSGVLWMLLASGETKRLGYEEFFKPMLNDDIVISYEEAEQEFYISNGSTCYVLTKNGLCRIGQVVSSVVNLNGEACGITLSRDTDTFVLQTDKFDFSSIGQKFIGFIEVGSIGLANVEVQVNAAYRGNYHTGSWRTVSNGIVYLGVSGEAFQLRIRGRMTDGAKLDYVNIKWKRTDRRFHRGLTNGAEQ